MSINQSLHSDFLTSHFGPVTLRILRQDLPCRMVHLNDPTGQCRTIAITKFAREIPGEITTVHERILDGAPLGKTIAESGIPFEKRRIGSFKVRLSEESNVVFGGSEREGIAVLSRIYVKDSESGGDSYYAQVLEAMPKEVYQLMDPLPEISYEEGTDVEEMLGMASLSLKESSKKIHRCIVVGAGPGGIVTTKELLEKGFEDTICLERSDCLGGIFSRSYDNLTLTSSVTFSMFSDFWVGEGMDHHFWSKEEAVSYWRDYASHFGVTPHIRFGTEVTRIRQGSDEIWDIEVTDGRKFRCKHLLLAIGNNHIPKYPEWKSKLTNLPFSHSRDYKNPSPFKGKNVLVVGGGESGSDVAYEISQVANQCWVSLRETTGWIVPRRRGGHAADVSTHRGIWDLPREFGQKLSPFVLRLERARKDPVFDALADLNEKVKSRNGIWGIFGTKTLALPKAIAHHGCKVVGEISEVKDGGRTLITSDGCSLEGIDAVVFSTGYLNRADFLPEYLRNCDPRKMYKHMFHPDLGDNLAWIGWARPGFGSQFPIMEMQARYCALIISGEKQLPVREEMIETARNDEQTYLDQFEENAKRIRSLVDYHGYMNSMARMIGCFPPLTRYFFTRPRLWMHLMYGPTQATQFRLRGPGRKPRLAREIIGKLPISTFNHIVKAGLRGRVYYGLRSVIPPILRRSA